MARSLCFQSGGAYRAIPIVSIVRFSGRAEREKKRKQIFPSIVEQTIFSEFKAKLVLDKDTRIYNMYVQDGPRRLVQSGKG
ncbi:hypothetical protein WH47_04588 [Habropoda laboriosa]|uniref:Uncharacterized protein n=1 Tax=Habropoda laboriosa TaxID=597456 RepID=A0A0L7R2E2_9HYME|nr:hypothetical protein WH47_04588 [Habropoda laboriosa]